MTIELGSKYFYIRENGAIERGIARAWHSFLGKEGEMVSIQMIDKYGLYEWVEEPRVFKTFGEARRFKPLFVY